HPARLAEPQPDQDGTGDALADDPRADEGPLPPADRRDADRGLALARAALEGDRAQLCGRPVLLGVQRRARRALPDGGRSEAERREQALPRGNLRATRDRDDALVVDRLRRGGGADRQARRALPRGGGNGVRQRPACAQLSRRGAIQRCRDQARLLRLRRLSEARAAPPPRRPPPPFAHAVSIVDLLFSTGPDAGRYMKSFADALTPLGA